METTVVYRVWDYIGDNGKENGNYYMKTAIFLEGRSMWEFVEGISIRS